MCGLYGVLSYANKIKNIERITEALAVESAVRGTDATGIAYNYHDRLNIFKRGKSAYLMEFDVPDGVAAVMGHTRNATQGTIKFNRNNHPFCGKCGKTAFALAHNGILCNDRILRKQLKLPKTKIETDSYIGVQLIESKSEFDLDTIQYMSENVEGSFSFSILDDCDNLYLVKGDSPITLFHFPTKSVYVYASTLSILWKALVDTELFCELQAGKYEEISIDDGEILEITAEGKIKREKFKYDVTFSHGLDWRHGFRYADYVDDYKEDLKSLAPYFGYDREDIDMLLNDGYMPEEIEEILYG